MNEEIEKKRISKIYRVVRKETIRKVQALEEEAKVELITNNKVDNHRIIHRNNTMDSKMQDDHEHNIDNTDRQMIARLNTTSR